MERLTLAEVVPTPAARALPRLATLASPLTGIVPLTYALPPSADDARLFRVAAVCADAGAVLGSSPNRYSTSAHFSREAALAAAIAGGLERYAAAYTCEDRLRVATAAQLGDEAPRAASFALFHERQYAEPGFPYERFTEDTRLRWTPAYRLADGAPAFVPTQLVHAGAVFYGEPQIGYATSSGLACAATREEAILAGLLELVARDALLIAWYGRLALPLVDVGADAALAAVLRRVFDPAGVRSAVVDLSALAGVPTALAVCRDARRGVALAAGCASAPTARDAVLGALREAFQTRAFARELRAELPDWRCDDVADIASFEDHALYYACAAGAAQAAFLDASPARVRVADVAPLAGGSVTGAIHALVGRLAAVGTSVYVVDTTPPDLRAAGVHAVAVVAPELCRLGAAQRYRYLGGRRPYHAACEAGLAPMPMSLRDINPLPHPLP